MLKFWNDHDEIALPKRRLKASIHGGQGRHEDMFTTGRWNAFSIYTINPNASPEPPTKIIRAFTVANRVLVRMLSHRSCSTNNRCA